MKLSELLGIMFGDGCLSSTIKSKPVVYIAGHKKDDLEYHEKVTKKLFKEIFNENVTINFRKGEQTLFIRTYNKNIFNELAKYMPIGKKYDSLKIPNQILANKKYFFAFVRGLADTDGCMIFSKQHRKMRYYPRIEITSKSFSFLETILTNLRKYGFYGSLSKKAIEAYRLEFPGFSNLKLWLNLVGFSNAKHKKKIEGQKLAF